jgi:hypothetical protein
MGAATVTGVHYAFRKLSDESQSQLVDLFAQRILENVGGVFPDSPQQRVTTREDKTKREA